MILSKGIGIKSYVCLRVDPEKKKEKYNIIFCPGPRRGLRAWATPDNPVRLRRTINKSSAALRGAIPQSLAERGPPENPKKSPKKIPKKSWPESGSLKNQPQQVC